MIAITINRKNQSLTDINIALYKKKVEREQGEKQKKS
jgi:hypothetical protein